MKSLTLVAALFTILTLEAKAEIFSTHYYYLHNETNRKLDFVKIDQETQTGRYFDYKDGKYKTVSMTEVTKETHGEIDGVRKGNMVLVKFQDQKLRPCEVWYLFENSMAHVGCQTGKMKVNVGVDRPELATYASHIDHIVREVNSLDGFAKSDKVRLMADVGDLKKGDLVRIEHIFQNGSAMIQKMGANLLDTSGLLMKYRVQIVDLKDLTLNK